MRAVRAVVAHAAGDLRVESRDPVTLEPGQVAVRVAFGGVCGSDLHYYHRGGVGDFVLREPLVLGHEVSGTVLEAGPQTGGPQTDGPQTDGPQTDGPQTDGPQTDGPQTDALPPGTPVTVHPATPCGTCAQCAAGRPNICPLTRYLGSAAHLPHVQGGFIDVLVVRREQLVVLPAGLGLERACLAEPLGVALHALSRAGDLRGRRVLITGAGPIGSLVAAAARHAGAAQVVVSDLVDEALQVALAVGATDVQRAEALAEADPLEVDVAIEASGAPPGLATCIQHVRRGGIVVQLGLLPPGTVPVPGNLLVTREIDLRGAFRFTDEILTAVTLLADGLPVDAILTHRFAVDDAAAAFAVAGDRRAASKVLLDFTGDV